MLIRVAHIKHLPLFLQWPKQSNWNDMQSSIENITIYFVHYIYNIFHALYNLCTINPIVHITQSEIWVNLYIRVPHDMVVFDQANVDPHGLNQVFCSCQHHTDDSMYHI